MKHIRTKILLVILCLGLLFCSAKAQVRLKEDPNKQDQASPKDTLKTLEEEWERVRTYQMLDGRAEEQLKAFLQEVLPKFTAPEDIPKWESKVPKLREAALKTVYLRDFPARALTDKPAVVWQELDAKNSHPHWKMSWSARIAKALSIFEK